MLSLARARAYFEQLLGYRTDAVTEAALKPPLRHEILRDAVDALGEWPDSARVGRKRWKWRLFELLAHLDALSELARTHTPEGLSADPLSRDAALLRLLRLGEGTKYVPQSVQDRHPQVPWATLRDVRNMVAHDYFGLDTALLWLTLTRELPLLRPALQRLAEESEGQAALPAARIGAGQES